MTGKTVFWLFCFLSTVANSNSNSFFPASLNRLKTFFGYENCADPDVRRSPEAIARLQRSLRQNLFGQHLVSDTVLPAIMGHLDLGSGGQGQPSSSKALVLSLHGWTGSGKTFTTQMIMDALYAQGEHSAFVRYFSASFHFPDHDPSQVERYKVMLQNNVTEVIERCPRSLFVFDEVDKLPAGLLDVLLPFIQHPGRLGGNVYTKAIFIFISNTGGNAIADIALKAHLKGRSREDLKLTDFEEILSNQAFNSQDDDGRGGLYKSRVIERILIDFFVPFLPLERSHVVQCVEREILNYKEVFESHLNFNNLDQEIKDIADRMSYWPDESEGPYSSVGCRRVENLVRFRATQLKLKGQSQVRRERSEL